MNNALKIALIVCLVVVLIVVFYIFAMLIAKSKRIKSGETVFIKEDNI